MNIYALAFLAGWFDPLEKRLLYMALFDRALKTKPNTQTVRLEIYD